MKQLALITYLLALLSCDCVGQGYLSITTPDMFERGIAAPAWTNDYLHVWYKPEFGQSVSLWEDYMENYDATDQNDVTEQPTVESEALNGYDGLNFDGVNDNFTNGWSRVNTSGTILVVAKHDLGGTTSDDYLYGNSGGGVDRFYVGISGGKAAAGVGSITQSTLVGTTTLGTDYHYITVVANAGTATLYVDGSLEDTESYSNDVSSEATGNGVADIFQSNLLWNGVIVEIIELTAALSGSDLTDMHDYISNKYGL